jgi:hypothetical protein
MEYQNRMDRAAKESRNAANLWRVSRQWQSTPARG